MEGLKKLVKMMSDSAYEPDAVAMSAETLMRIRKEFEQEYEKDFVSLYDLESHFGCKIMIYSNGNKEEFELYSLFKKGN